LNKVLAKVGKIKVGFTGDLGFFWISGHLIPMEDGGHKQSQNFSNKLQLGFASNLRKAQM